MSGAERRHNGQPMLVRLVAGEVRAEFGWTPSLEERQIADPQTWAPEVCFLVKRTGSAHFVLTAGTAIMGVQFSGALIAGETLTLTFNP